MESIYERKLHNVMRILNERVDESILLRNKTADSIKNIRKGQILSDTLQIERLLHDIDIELKSLLLIREKFIQELELK